LGGERSFANSALHMKKKYKAGCVRGWGGVRELSKATQRQKREKKGRERTHKTFVWVWVMQRVLCLIIRLGSGGQEKGLALGPIVIGAGFIEGGKRGMPGT